MTEAADWLVRLSLSRATESEIQAWIEWCAADERNLRALEDLEGFWRTIGDHPPSAGRLAQLLSQDEPTAPRSIPPGPKLPRSDEARRPVWRIASLSAIAGMLVVALGVILLHGLLGSRVARSATLATALGQHRVFVLWDGSTVELGGSSVVRANYTRRQRRLTVMQGEAYFQEIHQPDWPFVVAAGQLQATARGTAFDVVRSADQVAVSVVEGIVDVSIPAHSTTATMPADAGRTVELDPGHQLVLSNAGMVHEQRVDPRSVVAWRDGELESPDATLGEFIEAVDRYAPHPIILTDPALRALRYTGTAFTQSIDDWVDSLPEVFPITVDRTSKPGTIILKPR